jgi:hypothetical protein
MVKRETIERCEKDYSDAQLLRMALQMLGVFDEKFDDLSFLKNNLTYEVIKKRVAKNNWKGI